MSKFQSALSIGGIEHIFESRCLGLQLLDDLNDAAVDAFQPFSERIGRLRPDSAAADKNTIGAISIDDAVTSDSGSAIDAENPHELRNRFGQFGFLDIEIPVHVLHIIVLVQSFHQFDDLLRSLAFNLDVVLRNH